MRQTAVLVFRRRMASRSAHGRESMSQHIKQDSVVEDSEQATVPTAGGECMPVRLGGAWQRSAWIFLQQVLLKRGAM